MSTTAQPPSYRGDVEPPGALGFEVMGDLVVVVHGHSPPSDAAWASYLAATSSWPQVPHLVVTSGGAPTSAQRRALRDAWRCRPLRVAVVSASNRINLVVTAVSWFNPDIMLFRPDEIDRAMTYLATPSWRHCLVKRRVRALQESLGVEPFVT